MAADRQRLFFALWPDDDTRRALAALAGEHLPPGSGRPVEARNLHLTLVFLGSVDEAFRDCAERAAATISGAPFALDLRRIGHWPRPRVLWSAPESTPDALVGLVGALGNALIPCGHVPETRPYRAHITLARKVRGPLHGVDHELVRWPVTDFHLVASETHPRGARYSPLMSWPLSQPSMPAYPSMG
jgi:2'-5' RNA ligase